MGDRKPPPGDELAILLSAYERDSQRPMQLSEADAGRILADIADLPPQNVTIDLEPHCLSFVFGLPAMIRCRHRNAETIDLTYCDDVFQEVQRVAEHLAMDRRARIHLHARDADRFVRLVLETEVGLRRGLPMPMPKDVGRPSARRRA